MPKSTPTSLVRLNKLIADRGLCSRRKADEWISEGKVKLNGKTVYELGVKVDPKKDKIVVNGKPLKPEERKLYIAFYKPEHVVTSLSDPQNRPTVIDFFPKVRERIFPVGRLDWDTEGLLIMTNDGDFAQRVGHPSQEIPKTYEAKLDGRPTDAQLEKLRRGVSIEGGGRVKALYIERIKKGSDKYDWIRISVTEGKNRQVRKMFLKLGFDVKKLRRVAIGALPLSNLKKGEYAHITKAGLAKIFEKPKFLR